MGPFTFCFVLIVPATVIAGYFLGGIYTLTTPVFVFAVIPIVDWFRGIEPSNPPAATEPGLEESPAYRWITWICGGLQVVLVFWGAWAVGNGRLGWAEGLGFTVSMGISSGGMGITVGHELKHRVNERWEPRLGDLILWTVGYLHWGLEHVVGHHRRVATPEDPATARRGESYYAFWPRTVFGGFAAAWNFETNRLAKRKHPSWHPSNRILTQIVAELTLLLMLGVVLGPMAAVYFVIQSLVAVSLLEVVNYVEHYGLRRRMLNGRYEPVRPHHSWNSSNWLTNRFLFNLQRHSDHHWRPGRRYQVLRHIEESPQLPTGYAGMILLALVPPLWFRVMETRLRDWENHFGGNAIEQQK